MNQVVGNFPLAGWSGGGVAIPTPLAGTYTAVVRNFSAEPAVTFSGQIVAPTVSSTSLAYGSTITGAISKPGEIDEYTFLATAGQRVYFDALRLTRSILIPNRFALQFRCV